MSRELLILWVFAAVAIVAGISDLFILDHLKYTNFYMALMQVCFVLLLAIIRLQSKVKSVLVLSSALLILATSELIDELFFNPISTGWNDCLFIILMGWYVAMKIKK